jgi:uncharacterized membrane protein YfcA
METFFNQLQIFDFTTTQLALTLLIFVWSGFVRSGLGFGGAALALPLMLLIYDQPLFWLPIIGIHLLFFSALTLRNRMHNVNWQVLKQTSVYILPAKLAGVFGLLSLPNRWLIVIIYGITLIYALLWMLNIQIRSSKGWSDKILLGVGGYFSGTSLTGAPVIAAVYAHLVEKERLRDTMFVLWFILVVIKLTTLAAFGIDLQIVTSIMLIPIAMIGHILGLRAHEYMLQNDKLFKRVLGSVLIAICVVGLGSLI